MSQKHPQGLFVLFTTELWERFSYYGMRALLMLFMVAPLTAGGLGFDAPHAGLIYGTYTMSVYMLAIPGGYIADNFLGARRAVLFGGIIIALGHFSMATTSQTMFLLGLCLIAIGTGLLKPNISTMVGSLYAKGDDRRDAGFSIFYMGINIGAFVAPLITGFLAQHQVFKDWLAANGFNPLHSWHWGFGAAGVGMTLGLVVYLLNARHLHHVGVRPPIDPKIGRRPWLQLCMVLLGAALFFKIVRLSDTPNFMWLRYLFIIGPVGLILWGASSANLDRKRLAAVFVFFIAAMIFWAIFEQAGSTISLFGDTLTRTEVLGRPFPSSWFQSINPLFVMLLAPLFAELWTRLGPRQPSSPIKFAFGLGALGLSFLLMVPAAQLSAAGKVSPWWLVGMFFLQTVGELCLSPVGLSTMTKLAPAKLVGLVMGIWFLAASLGNKLAGVFAGEFTSDNPVQLAHFFLILSIWVGAFTLLLCCLVPWMKKLMGDVK